MQVRIGKVRGNAKLALHLEIDGRTCATNRPVNVESVTANCGTAKLCKRCFTPERIKTAQLRSQSGRFNAKADTILTWAVDMTRTPAEREYIASLVARVQQPRSLAELRNAYSNTHKQAADRGGYVRIAA